MQTNTNALTLNSLSAAPTLRPHFLFSFCSCHLMHTVTDVTAPFPLGTVRSTEEGPLFCSQVYLWNPGWHLAHSRYWVTVVNGWLTLSVTEQANARTGVITLLYVLDVAFPYELTMAQWSVVNNHPQQYCKLRRTLIASNTVGGVGPWENTEA